MCDTTTITSDTLQELTFLQEVTETMQEKFFHWIGDELDSSIQKQKMMQNEKLRMAES